MFMRTVAINTNYRPTTRLVVLMLFVCSARNNRVGGGAVNRFDCPHHPMLAMMRLRFLQGTTQP